jgi:NADPH:quinone reductase-like Zn-dependent oxidoreductase
MKAVIQLRYGPPESLELADVAVPKLAKSEVRIRVCAASVNRGDAHLMRGTPLVVRLMGHGVRRPKQRIVGRDAAGIVEEVGSAVSEWAVGDEVFGWCRGAFGECAVASEDTLVPKPASVTFERAAAAPTAGVTALQGLRDRGRLRADQRVLVVGASGGVGTAAVQIAKAWGAHVTAVCSTRNIGFVRSLGADEIVDYVVRDFTETQRRYDLILDLVGSHGLRECRRALEPRGTYVAVGGPSGRWVKGIGRPMRASMLSWFVGETFRPLFSVARREDLLELAEYLSAGLVAPVIDRRFDLTEVRDAVRYIERGSARGKVLITP